MPNSMHRILSAMHDCPVRRLRCSTTDCEAACSSGRGLHRVHRVARTLADLEGVDALDAHHVAEALTLRAGRSVLAIGGYR